MAKNGSNSDEKYENGKVVGQVSNEAKMVRNFAFVIYPDSAPKDWKKKMDEMHIKILWIYHDQDVKEDGTAKKPHYHVMIMWPNNTTFSFARNIASELGAANDYIELVRNTSSYARYMCHLDQPDKHQYPVKELKALGGVDRAKLVKERQEEKVSSLQNLLQVCKENDLRYYCEVVDYCLAHNQKWAEMLLDVRFGRLIQDYIKSYYWMEYQQM